MTTTTTRPADIRLGTLALERGLISRGELDALLDRARPPAGGTQRRALLGELLVREKFLGATLLAELLQEQRRRQRGSAAPAPQEAPLVASLDGLLAELARQAGRALVLVSGRPPALRLIDGLAAARTTMSTEQLETIRREVFGCDVHAAEKGADVATVSFERHGRRYRATVGDSLQGRSLVIQPVGLDTLTSALRLPASIAALASHRRGLILIAGGRPAAVTDVLAGLVAEIAGNSRRHVIAIERHPIYDHVSSRGLVSQRSVGEHTESYATALRAALREDPDVIAIGEMRDPDAIATALLAAETGHLVLAGVHAADAAQALRRTVTAHDASRQGIARATLASTLQALAVVDVVRGRKGHHVVADIVPGSAALANLIREDRLHHLEATIANQPGVITRDRRLAELVATGEVPRIAAIERARDAEAAAGLGRSTQRHD